MMIDVARDPMSNRPLHEVFRELRMDRRMTQGEAARLLNVSQSTISAFELGRYENVRKKTLNGMHRLIQFWRRDATGAAEAEADFSTDFEDANEMSSGRCTICGSRIPDLEPPARFCPACGEALAITCSCGYTSQDAEANFCSRCGRILIDSEAIAHSYPGLQNNEAETARLLLRRRLDNAIDQILGVNEDVIFRTEERESSST